MNIEKAKERFNKLIKVEHANWIGISNQEAIKTVLSELEYKQDDINVLQAQRDSVENQLKQAKAELEKKDKIIDKALKTINDLKDGRYREGSKMYYYSSCCNGRLTVIQKILENKEYFTKKVEEK